MAVGTAGAYTLERTVYHASSETTLVRDVSEDMLLLEPDQSPLLVLTNKNKRTAPADAPKFEWFEDQEVAVWDFVASTKAYSTTATTILVNDPTIYCVGDLLLVAAAINSSAEDELMLVGTVGTDSVVVTRKVGGGTAIAIGSSAAIRILSGAMVEGGAVPSVRTTKKAAKYSYCAIFRDAIDVSRTMQATKAYATPQGERRYQQMKALARHKQSIEAAMLWSKAALLPSDAYVEAGSRWMTQGVKATIDTNITDASSTFALTKFNDFSETAFRYGASEKLLIAAPKIISALNYWSQSKLITHVGDKVFGVAIGRMLANGFGEFLLANNFRMGDTASSGAKHGFEGEAYSIDLPSVRYRYLAGNGLSQNTKLYENVKQDGYARTVDEYYSQVGAEVRHDKKHARLYNVTGYS